MVKIADSLSIDTIIPSLTSTDKVEVLKELAEKLSEAHPIINKERLIEALIEREKLCSTAVDSGVAIPHAKLSGISDIILGFGKSDKGLEFDSLDRHPTNLFIVLLSPENSTGQHIELLARISMIFKKSELRSELLKASSEQDIYDCIVSEDEKLR